MDGLVIWIYAIFDLSSVEIKIWMKLIFLTDFNAYFVNNYKAIIFKSFKQSWSF